MSEIKKQYRKLSKVYHPDKQGGNQEMFMKIAKAYEALTDDVSRENWEKYGNPDGPQAATFGIALPSWIVEKDNSIWVLVLYMAVFAIVLPVIVVGDALPCLVGLSPYLLSPCAGCVVVPLYQVRLHQCATTNLSNISIFYG